MRDYQEGSKVVVEKYFYGEIYSCPKCGKHLGYDYDKLDDINFCSKCGEKLKKTE